MAGPDDEVVRMVIELDEQQVQAQANRAAQIISEKIGGNFSAGPAIASAATGGRTSSTPQISASDRQAAEKYYRDLGNRADAERKRVAEEIGKAIKEGFAYAVRSEGPGMGAAYRVAASAAGVGLGAFADFAGGRGVIQRAQILHQQAQEKKQQEINDRGFGSPSKSLQYPLAFPMQNWAGAPKGWNSWQAWARSRAKYQAQADSMSGNITGTWDPRTGMGTGSFANGGVARIRIPNGPGFGGGAGGGGGGNWAAGAGGGGQGKLHVGILAALKFAGVDFAAVGLAVAGAIASAGAALAGALEGLLKVFGKYNPQIRQESAIYNRELRLINIQLGQRLSPLLVQWIKLKEQFVIGFAQAAPIIGGIAKLLTGLLGIIGSVMKYLMAIGHVFYALGRIVAAILNPFNIFGKAISSAGWAINRFYEIIARGLNIVAGFFNFIADFISDPVGTITRLAKHEAGIIAGSSGPLDAIKKTYGWVEGKVKSWGDGAGDSDILNASIAFNRDFVDSMRNFHGGPRTGRGFYSANDQAAKAPTINDLYKRWNRNTDPGLIPGVRQRGMGKHNKYVDGTVYPKNGTGNQPTTQPAGDHIGGANPSAAKTPPTTYKAPTMKGNTLALTVQNYHEFKVQNDALMNEYLNDVRRSLRKSMESWKNETTLLANQIAGRNLVYQM